MGLVTWPHYHHICAWLVLVILHTQVCSSYYTHRSVPVIDVSSQMCMHAFMQLHRIARSNIDAQYMFIDNKCSRCSQLRSWSTNIWFCRRRVIWDRNVLRHNWQTFCLIEVRAMVVVVQQPLAECTTIFTVCIVEHRPPPYAVTITQNPHKSAVEQIPRQCLHPRSKVNVLATHKHFELSQ